MGHIFTDACQGLLSLLQKLPLFWSINILLGSLFSYTQTNEHTHCHAMHKFISVHCQAQALRCSLVVLRSDVLQQESQRIRFFSLGPWRHQWRRVLFQFWIPLRTIEGIGWYVRVERAQYNTFIFTCNHSASATHPSLMPSSLLPLLLLPLSMNWFSLITLHTCPLVWLHSYLALSHRHTTTAFYFFLRSPPCHTHTYTNTHRHSNQIRQSLVFLNTAAKVRYGYSLSFQPRLRISISAKLWSRLTKIEARCVFEYT